MTVYYTEIRISVSKLDVSDISEMVMGRPKESLRLVFCIGDERLNTKNSMRVGDAGANMSESWSGNALN